MGEPTVGARQRRGISLVSALRGPICSAAREYGVPSELIAVILMHESQASERRLYRFLVGSAEMGERAQASLQGDSASIGVAQMRIGRARQLRRAYPRLRVADDVIDDLLMPSSAVRYLAANLRQIRNELSAFLAREGASLTREQEIDMLALGYNIGWENLRDRNLRDPTFGSDIPARVETIRSRSQYLRLTTVYLQAVRPLLVGSLF